MPSTEPPQRTLKRGRPPRAGLVPAVQVCEYLRLQPGFRHELGAVIAHFTGASIRARKGTAKNLDHAAWIYRLRQARSVIEAEYKVTWKARRHGRKLEYFAQGGTM